MAAKSAAAAVAAGPAGPEEEEERGERQELNPFEYDAPVTAYELGKMVLFTVTLIAPLRLAIFSVLVLLAYLCARVATIGIASGDELYAAPLARWRRLALAPVSGLCRAALFVFGFYHVQVRGRPSPEACLFTPNHVSLFDLLAMYWLLLPSALSKAEAFKVPLVGTLFRALQVIPVQRESEEDKAKAQATIRRFAASRTSDSGPRFPPILVFPQGTTTRHNVLTMFQRGAFRPGLPVQPVALRYPWKHFDPAFVVNHKTDYYLYRHLCQFSMQLEVTFLPVHEPSKAERADATLFANNVRATIAEHLGASTTNHCYEDAKLYRAALNLDERSKPPRLLHAGEHRAQGALGTLELKTVKDMFQVGGDNDHDASQRFTLADAKLLLQNFVAADTDGDGKLSLEEFAAAAHFDPNSSLTRKLFSFFDRDESGAIDFREMVIGMAACNPYSSSEDRLRFAFQVYDANDDGLVTESDLRQLLRYAGEATTSRHAQATREQLERLLDRVRASRGGSGEADSEDKGELKLSWEDFKAHVPRESELVSTAILSIDARRDGGPDLFPTMVRRRSSRVQVEQGGR